MDRGVIEIHIPHIKYNFSKTPNVNEVLEALNADLSNILYDTPVKLSYSELYNLVDDLCVLHHDDDVRQTQQNIIEHYVYTQILALDLLHAADFLHALRHLWTTFSVKVALIRNIYLPLEVTTLKQQHRKYVISNMAHELFNNTLLQDERISGKFTHIFDIMDQYRSYANVSPEMIPEKVDMTLLKDLVNMLSKLHLYHEYFEVSYLTAAQAYYRQVRVTLMTLGVFDYFRCIQERLSQEQVLVTLCLKERTWSKIQLVVKRILIEEVFPELLEKLNAENVFGGDLKDIALIYNQVAYLPRAKEELCAIFSKYMLNNGRGIVFNRNDTTVIPRLLEFRVRVDLIVSESCGNAYAWVDAVRMAFKRFINLRKNKPAQLLAKFIDSKMRDKLIPEDLFDKTIVMFRYLQPKDIFEAYYKRYLAKRLLLGKSSSQDAEKAMIGKLKYECGDGFTAKLEGMFRDVDLSDGLIQAFKQRGQRGPDDVIDFTAQVLTCSFWPTFGKFKVTLPKSMQQYHNLYQEFYKSKYSGRSLDWPGSLDTCLLKARLPKGCKELQVSLFQAVILLLFNDSQKVSYQSMKELLGLEEVELKRTLGSLVGWLGKLLRVVPKEEELKEEEGSQIKGDSKSLLALLGDGTEFEVNEAFEHKLFRIRVNQLQYKDTEEEQKITEEEVLHDRNLHIDAAVVRLMKQHQSLKHAELVTKLYGVLKFPINPNDIKKRIEVLIERDFLARNPNDASGYIYVA